MLYASSAPPLLECHSSISNLKELLENLYNRIRKLSYPLDFLEKLMTTMNGTSGMSNKVFYWPEVTPLFTAPSIAKPVIMDKNNQDEKIFTMDMVNTPNQSSSSSSSDNDYVFYPPLVKILYDRQLKISSSNRNQPICELFTMRIGRSRFVVQPGSEFIVSVCSLSSCFHSFTHLYRWIVIYSIWIVI